MKLALFDLDDTLLDGDSDWHWAQYLIGRGVLDRGEYERRNAEFHGRYSSGTLDIHEYLEFQLAPIAGRSREELDEWHRGFMAERLRAIIHPKTPSLLAAHADALVAIVTATNRFVTGPIAAELGVPHLIASEPEELPDGRFTGRPAGTPAFREGKVERLHGWLSSLGRRLEEFEETWFYSDSRNDLPLLELVSRPVAVDPDPTLESHARDRGWPILRMRA